MDKVILTFGIVAVVDAVQDFVPAIKGKAIVRILALFAGAGMGAVNVALSGGDMKTGIGAGIACAVAAIGGVAMADRHADRAAGQ